MAKERVLPDLKTRIVVDDTQLKKVGPTASKSLGAAEAAAKKSSKAVHGLAVEAEGVASKIGLVPNAAKGAAGSLGNLASSGVLTGSVLTAVGGVATVAAGLLVAGAQMSIQMYGQLADKVEAYKRVTGSSAEESGRMVQTFEALGVSADTVAGGMFKLSSAIERTPKKLAELGIQVAHSKDGNVDLGKTLFSVADAYNGTADAARRNAILFATFGKSGADMIPVLEQGSASLRRLEESARLTFSEDDLRRMKELAIKQREVKQGWDAMWETIGQQFVPAEDAAASAVLAEEYAQRKLQAAIRDGTITRVQAGNTAKGLSPIVAKYLDDARKEWTAEQTKKAALTAATQAIIDQQKATDDLVKSADALISADDKIYKINETVAGQRDKVTSATWDVRDAEKTLADDRKKYGGRSEQAIRDAIALRGAQQNLTDTIHQGGQDRRQQIIDQEALVGPTRDLNKENAAEIRYYTEMLKHVGKGTPLYKRLQEWIALLRAVPTGVSTEILADFIKTGPHGRTKAYAGGGRPPLGEDVWVGEHGPELARFDRPVTIVPHGATPTSDPGASIDVSGIEDRLDALIFAVTQAPSGQPGAIAALYKAMQGAGMNRARGMAGT